MRLKPLFLIPGLLAILSLVRVSGSELVINEFMAENTRGLQDGDGSFSDWIEGFTLLFLISAAAARDSAGELTCA